jgi:hypothetical protein
VVVAVERLEAREQEPHIVEGATRETEQSGIIDIASLLGAPTVTIVRSTL